MRKKNFFKLLFVVFNAALLFIVFGITAGATDSSVQGLNQPDAFTIKELNIITNHAILEGQTLQMQVEEFEEFVLLGSVEWSSSKPDIISCSKNGEIKGLKEGKATIKVKAKVGNASDSITVYCAKKLNEPKRSRIKNAVAWTTQTPFLLNIQTLHFNIFPVWFTEKLDVKGVYGSFFYVEFERGERRFKGFIPQIWMPDGLVSSEVFSELSVYDLDVYVGQDREQYVLTTDYEGTVKWSVSDDEIIEFNDKTGKIKTKKTGTATISATVGNKTLTCTIHSIYRWPLDWTGAARQTTYVYKAKGNTYEESSTPLAVGDTFTVKGDMGGDSEWVYGISENGTWGYVPISHISTKGTISQYNNLETTLENGEKVPWVWPVNDLEKATKARYITSPYGWRDTDPARHKGIDVTNGISSDSNSSNTIDGYEVVSAFAGKVIFVHDISTGYKSCGNCVAIRSNEKDPITGEYYVAIYMHLKSKPKVSENQNISANKLLGYVGNTGNSRGSHLHFEVNNQNLSYGQKIYYENDPEKEMYFGSLINPLFFYMDYYNLPDGNPHKIKINPGCDAMKYRKPLWYGDDIKESKTP